MKENAILVKPSSIEKIYVDFSDDKNICNAIEAKGLSTIHTIKTQEMSRKLGFHIVGYVDRYGGYLNNELAAQISGYDGIYSLMVLCKTNDKWDSLPLGEEELECLFTYLTTGKIAPANNNKGSKAFFEKYGIENPALPKIDFEPETYQLPEVPYVMLFRYDLQKMNDRQIEDFGRALFFMSNRLIEGGFTEVDGAKLSPDEKYYINSCMDGEKGIFNVLIQAKGEEEVVIANVLASADGIMGKTPKHEHVDMDTAIEEADD